MKKKIIFIFFLILFLNIQPSVKAGDISDFEIEGISIGDSLLDHYSEDVILKNIKWHYNNNRKDNKFVIVEFYNLEKGEIYDGLQVAIKPDDKKYRVYVISGAIKYKYNIKECYSKMKEIDKELTKLFVNANRNEVLNSVNKSDVTGKSYYSGVYYYFDDKKNNSSRKANASVQCYDWSEESSSTDNLRVGIRSGEYRDWYFTSRK